MLTFNRRFRTHGLLVVGTLNIADARRDSDGIPCFASWFTMIFKCGSSPSNVSRTVNKRCGSFGCKLTWWAAIYKRFLSVYGVTANDTPDQYVGVITEFLYVLLKHAFGC